MFHGKIIISFFVLIVALNFSSCEDNRLSDITIHDNPFLKVISDPVVLVDNLDNPATPFFIDKRVIFAEGGKGTIAEYKEKEMVSLIEGFGLDNYAGYSISVLGITSVPGEKTWIVAASEDDGHILVFDESTFPTKATEGREIEIERTEPINPFAVLLVDKGNILVASGGTKAAYQGFFDVINPGPLKPVFEVDTGIAGLEEDPRTGDILGAIIGSGQNDGYLVRWDPKADTIKPKAIADGFSNLVDVLMMPNGLLAVLEFGAFETPGSGRVLLIDPNSPDKRYPLISGLDAPSGFALDAENNLLITTFGKNRAEADGMLITLQIDLKK